MGLMDTMKDAMDSVRKYELKEALTIEQLYELIKADAALTAQGEVSFKKGMFGKSINFPKISRVTPVITVKNNVVTLKNVEDRSTSAVSVGGMSFAKDKDMRGGNAINTTQAGSAYFKGVAELVGKLLEDK